MQLYGFLAAVKFAVRCACRSVLVVVQPAYAVRCSFVVVALLFPTSTIFFLRNKHNAYEHIHPPYVPHMTREYLASLYYSARILSNSSPLGVVVDPYTHDNEPH